MATENGAWSPRDATDEIRKIAQSSALTISYKDHAIDRMKERGIIVSDVLFVLKYGYVYQAPLPSTRPGFNKYDIECRTPNSGQRNVRVIVIPDKKSCFLKIVTVMWVDETATAAGNIIGETDE